MQATEKLWRLADVTHEVDPRFDLLSYRVFLFIAMSGTTNAVTIQRKLDIPQSTASRCIANLSCIGSETKDGMNLVALGPNPDDRRQYILSLTPNGKGFLSALETIIEG